MLQNTKNNGNKIMKSFKLFIRSQVRLGSWGLPIIIYNKYILFKIN